MQLERPHVLSLNNRNTKRLSEQLYRETKCLSAWQEKGARATSGFPQCTNTNPLTWEDGWWVQSMCDRPECLLSRYALTMTLMEWPAARKGRKRGVTQRRRCGICLPPLVRYISSDESHSLSKNAHSSRNMSSCAARVRRLIFLLLAAGQRTPTERQSNKLMN